MPARLIVTDGPKKGLSIELEDTDEWIIGRNPDECDTVLDDPNVSDRQARLHQNKQGVFIENLDPSFDVLVNDEEITSSHLLKEGDEVQIGSTHFAYLQAPEEKKSAKGGYDDIFGDIESEEEPLEESKEEKEEVTEEDHDIPPIPPKPEMSAYDTIFEDSVEDEDLPFNIPEEPPLMLKVIAGPNAGAEIALEKGKTYTIGKDPNTCDIVFQDLSVSREHARLTVSEEKTFFIEDLESKNKTAVNGDVISERMQVYPNELIALGTTIFMIIDQDSPEETIYSPVSKLHTEPEEESKKLAEEQGDWKKKPIPMKYLVIGASVAAIFLIMFTSFFSLFKSSSVHVAHKEPVSEIKKALEKFEDVQYSYNPGSGKLFLVGHVLTSVDYQEMNYRLNQISFIQSIEDTVVIDEKVWKTMNDVISTYPNWRSVSIHSPKAGQFVVSGYLETIEEGVELYDYLTVNFPYLDRLKNHIVIEKTLDTQITGLIANAQLGGIEFQLSNGNVVLSGNYIEKNERELKKLEKEIQHIQGVISVKNYAIAAHESGVGINISQNYQITGSSSYDGKGYSVVMNGKIYTLGDRVDGMKILSIGSSTILLEKDGLKYKIDYTR